MTAYGIITRGLGCTADLYVECHVERQQLS